VIPPTVGRVVLVKDRHQCEDKTQPEVGFITFVHNDTCINVAGFDHYGGHFSLTSLTLIQDGVETPEHITVRAEWMPYQKGQAAKTEAAEAAAKAAGA
jgi:hypothetical protein